MTDTALKKYFIEFMEMNNSRAAAKVFDKLFRIHRGNLINILRQWQEEIDRENIKNAKTN